MNRYVKLVWASVPAMVGLMMNPAASTAQTVRQFEVDAQGRMHEIGVPAAENPVPEERLVTYTRIIVPDNRYIAQAEPRPENLAENEVNVYGYMPPQQQGHPSPWYGQNYTENWMYSLNDYNLRDDYRLLNKATGTAANLGADSQVYGYVESEPPPEQPARRVTGRVTELSIADTAPVPRLAIVVETDEGLARRVLLGTVQDARKLSLALGDRVTVGGRPEMVNGTSMLVAERLERTRERGQVQMRAEAAPQQAPPPAREYRGMIVRTRTEPLAGQNRILFLATIRLDDGSTVQADLGPADQLPVGRFRPNDRITFMGRARQTTGGESVVLVDSLRLESETSMRINR